MSIDSIVRTEFPEGHVVFFGIDGKIIMTPQSYEHSSTIKSMQYDTVVSLGRHAKTPSDVYIDFPADENSAPDLAILRQDARREGRRYGFADVLLISEVVSVSSARKDYDDCTAKYGRYDIPIYLVVDPYASEVVVHTEPTGSGYATAETHPYGTGKLPIPLADGRTFVLDLDELPLPEPETDPS
ncbi:Uma2 family endonuclease [Streptomyces sp. AC536]|uniref:Uma2 family endonuclease n=1 Tax=Streptomyces buecherae TaxID=2763006 RepID=UPI00164DD0C7|nr:Uma2 family endonuclease [Streptomyces buecherae]MBC3984876.1 Uma2 family endonuclease [Streptomyces buecherae]QNJ40451.1 Uma2 family endonuclease [Streptomyces buecherae]